MVNIRTLEDIVICLGVIVRVRVVFRKTALLLADNQQLKQFILLGSNPALSNFPCRMDVRGSRLRTKREISTCNSFNKMPFTIRSKRYSDLFSANHHKISVNSCYLVVTRWDTP